MTDDAPFEEAAEEAAARCPACLATVAAGQQYCLECGERLAPPGPPPASPLHRLARTPGLALIGGALAVILFGGFAIAWGFTRDDTTKVRRPASTGQSTHATAPTGPTGPTVSTLTGSESIPTFSNTIPTEPPLPTTTEPPPPTTTGPTEPPAVDSDSWPNGRKAWAAIIYSEDSSTHDYSEFVAKRTKAKSDGLKNVGLLNSDDYSSLEAGYYVVYQGPYSKKADAVAAAKAAQAKGWPGSYPRQIEEL